MTEAFTRLRVAVPKQIGEAHSGAIAVEAERLGRAMDAGDDAQALGYLKCLVESVAKVVLDLDGEPAASNASFETVVNKAHGLIARQNGEDLAYDTPFANLATQAKKMALSMGTIRNEFGAGHGRARQPELTLEMLTLAMDASLLWVRWAVRRLDAFAEGRPETLIRDLVGDPFGAISFSAGSLSRRLTAAGLADIEPRHARAIGLAVGQRAARDTFNVRIDGVSPPASDADLEGWPPPYRLGVTRGLLLSPDGRSTITARNLMQAIQVATPVPDASDELNDLIQEVLQTVPPGRLVGDPDSVAALSWWVDQHAPSRPTEEQASWAALAWHLRGVAPPA